MLHSEHKHEKIARGQKPEICIFVSFSRTFFLSKDETFNKKNVWHKQNYLSAQNNLIVKS